MALAPTPALGITLRMLKGAALAGVYPPGMKIAAGWFRQGRGWAIGILVGALTLGLAAPHLVRWAVPAEHWRPILVVAAASAFLGGLLVLTLSGSCALAVGTLFARPLALLLPVLLIVGRHRGRGLRAVFRGGQ